jgi:hypothetical protein
MKYDPSCIAIGIGCENDVFGIDTYSGTGGLGISVYPISSE